MIQRVVKNVLPSTWFIRSDSSNNQDSLVITHRTIPTPEGRSKIFWSLHKNRERFLIVKPFQHYPLLRSTLSINPKYLVTSTNLNQKDNAIKIKRNNPAFNDDFKNWQSTNYYQRTMNIICSMIFKTVIINITEKHFAQICMRSQECLIGEVSFNVILFHRSLLRKAVWLRIQSLWMLPILSLPGSKQKNIGPSSEVATSFIVVLRRVSTISRGRDGEC